MGYFVMYGIVDAQGRVLRDERTIKRVLNAYARSTTCRVCKKPAVVGDTCIDCHRKKTLAKSAATTANRATELVNVHQITPTPEPPPTRWNQHALSLRSPWRAAPTPEED